MATEKNKMPAGSKVAAGKALRPVKAAARSLDAKILTQKRMSVSAPAATLVTKVAKPARIIAKAPPEPAVDQARNRQVGNGQVRIGPVSMIGSIIEPMSLLFDTDWYRAEYRDVAAAGLDPIRHFFDDGAREGRNPNAYFVTNWYLSTNADVVASNMNPFLHYLLYGAREGRRPTP